MKREHFIYSVINELAHEILSGENDCMEFKANGLMDLVIEKIASDEISISHFYIQNSDLMYDPEITYKIDFNNKKLEPLTFRNDGMNLYQEVYLSEDRYRPTLRNQLLTFSKDWFKNIKSQNYSLEKK